MDDFDRYLFQEAFKYAADNSDDDFIRVGAVLVRDNKIISYGTNRMLDGVEKRPERMKMPEFLDWVYHAERDALSNARRDLVSIVGAKMYCPWKPCIDCAKEVISAGVSEMIFHQETNDYADARCDEDWGQNKAVEILDACKTITHRTVSGNVFEHDFYVQFFESDFNP